MMDHGFLNKGLLWLAILIWEDPLSVPMWNVEFWVHILDLQPCFWTGRVAENIENYIGSFVCSEKNSFDGSWKAFLWIKVLVDIRKPLKARIRLKKPGGDWNVITFQYEELSYFCFFYGIIGHSDKFCEAKYDSFGGIVKFKFDSSLRVK